MTTVLGIDGATHSSGYSIFNEETGDLLDWGVVSGGDSDDSYVRTLVIISEFRKIIKKYGIQKVIAEKPIPTFRNSVTLTMLCVLQGAILLMCNDLCLPVQFVDVSTWRSRLGWDKMTRPEYKAASVNFANDEFGLKLKKKDDDIADAINLCYATLYLKPSKYDLKKKTQ